MRLLKVILFFVLVFLIYVFLPRSSERIIYFPKNSNANFSNYLKNQNIPLNSFEIMLLQKYVSIKPGWVRCSGVVNKLDLYKLALKDKINKTRVVVMYSGQSIDDFATKFAKQTNLQKNDILQVYNELSNFKDSAIIAGKYKLPFNITPKAAIGYMIAKSNQVFMQFSTDFKSQEFKKRLIVASIIQKETQKTSEMGLVASVIYNRLKVNKKLQMDATLNYGKNSNKIITPQMIKNNNTKYNTYKHKGLPPEPICAVSKEALDAAFNPAISEYLYFVKSKNGHKFSVNYNAHLQNVKDYKGKLYAKRVAKVLKSGVRIDFPTLIFAPKIPTVKHK